MSLADTEEAASGGMTDSDRRAAATRQRLLYYSGAGWVRGWWARREGERRHVVAVGLITVATTLVYAVYLLVRFYNGQTGLFDIGIYDQAISNYAHFRGPHTMVLGLPKAGDLGNLQLSDHFTPMLMVFVPFYWLHDAPTTLLVCTAVLIASAIPPIWIITRRLLGTTAAYLVTIVYVVAWENQAQLWFAFHEVAFTAPIIAWMLERALVGKRRQAAAISLLLLLVKDDMGFLVAAFAIYLLFSKGFDREAWRDRTRLLGAGALIAIGFVMVELVNKVLIPHFGGSPQRNWTYGRFADSPGGLVKYMVKHPWEIIQTLYTPEDKIETTRWLLEPLLFLPLLSPIALLGVPLLVERFLADNSFYWNTRLHYNAFLVVILVVAAVDGAARLIRWTKKNKRLQRWAEQRTGRLRPRTWMAGTALASLAVIVSLDTLPKWPMWEMTTSAFWNSTHDHLAIAQRHAASHVPKGVLVAAPSNTGPFLLGRTTSVLTWSPNGNRSVVAPDWVITSTREPSYPWATVADQVAATKELRSQGYRLVFTEGGFQVLHKG